MKTTFSFGKNWQNFLKSIDKDRVTIAKKSIVDFLGLDNLRDKSFLDIGCGSGLFSYVASNLGAKKIISFDLDPFSVKCCEYLRGKTNYPENWNVYLGSILDSDFIARLGRFDIVYAWGVLHHTGNMWNAIRNAANLVEKNGYYYLAIYNKVAGRKGSEFWLKVKTIYNSSPQIGKFAIELMYALVFSVSLFIRFRNPFSEIRSYKDKRGMEWLTDVRDWLGGYPYEFATVEEILKFINIHFPDFKLMNIKISRGLGNNWFLFKRIEII